MAKRAEGGNRVFVTGVGLIAPEPFAAAAVMPTAPEITAFETPADAPAFGFECVSFRLEEHLPSFRSYADRTSTLTLAAAAAALKDAGLSAAETWPGEVGCAHALTFGCLDSVEVFLKKLAGGNPKFAPPLPFTHGYANSPSSLLCIEFGLRGPAATFAGDGLTGLQALSYAHDLVAAAKDEKAPGARIVAVAGEALSRAVHAHWFAAGRLEADGSPRPWSGKAAEVIPGEGAAALVLESEAAVRARGATVLSELISVGLGTAATGAGKETPTAEACGLKAWESAAKAACAAPGAAPKPDDVALFCAATPVPKLLDAAERDFFRRFFREHSPVGGAVVAPKFYAGEQASVSPLTAAATAVAVLSGRVRGTGLPLLELGEEMFAGGAAAAATAMEKEFTVALVAAADCLASTSSTGPATGLVVFRQAT